MTQGPPENGYQAPDRPTYSPQPTIGGSTSLDGYGHPLPSPEAPTIALPGSGASPAGSPRPGDAPSNAQPQFAQPDYAQPEYGQPEYAPADYPPAATPAVTPAPAAKSGSVDAAGRRHSRAGAAWVALIVAAVVVIFLLIFIVQNSDQVQVRYFGFEGTLSLGVAMAFAAIAGALAAGLLGTVRILQLRAKAKRANSGK